MTLRFGLSVDSQAAASGDLGAFLTSELRLVHLVRDAGWDSIWVVHHYMPESMRMPQPGPWLGRLAPEIGDMEVGVGILLLSILNPLDVAETYGTVDVLTGGRLILGVGMGYRAEEFGAFGVDPADRLKRFIGNLAALKALWEAEGGVDVDLPWCKVSNASLGALPVRRPRPPIWIGATQEPAIRRAARLGDAWLIPPVMTRDDVRLQLGFYRDEMSSEKRDRQRIFPISREVVCAPTDREALALAQEYLRPKYSAYAASGGLPSGGFDPERFADFSKGRFIIGSPNRCVEELTDFVDAGLNDFVFRTRWLGMPEDAALASLRLICQEVVPALRQYAAQDVKATAPQSTLVP
jgi:alkanesulfonate monooxygenase SsuD/methylene tetrahydromethanopterin reductase-like flavin-dependent oxidoreductase (luciferase family)